MYIKEMNSTNSVMVTWVSDLCLNFLISGISVCVWQKAARCLTFLSREQTKGN